MNTILNDHERKQRLPFDASTKPLGTSSKLPAHWLRELEPELSRKLEMQNRFKNKSCILVGAVAAGCDWITVAAGLLECTRLSL